MALFGLFGGNKDNQPQKGDFFLDFEEAQTLGDTEYMKQTKTIKRTFPKLKGQGGKTIISQVSADNMRSMDPNEPASAPADPTTSSFSSTSSFAPEAASFTPAASFSTPAPEFITPAPEPITPAPEPITPAPEPVGEKKEFVAPEPPPAPDNSMDMFRSMAKNIRR